MLQSNYKILKKHQIIIEYHKGIITLESFVNFKKEITKNKDFIKDLKYLVYLTDAVFNTSPSDIEAYIQFLKDNVAVYGKRKVALITDTPNQVVATTLFKTLEEVSSQNIEIFSTTGKAYEWLQVPNLPLDKVNKILSDLKNKLA